MHGIRYVYVFLNLYLCSFTLYILTYIELNLVNSGTKSNLKQLGELIYCWMEFSWRISELFRKVVQTFLKSCL